MRIYDFALQPSLHVPRRALKLVSGSRASTCLLSRGDHFTLVR